MKAKSIALGLVVPLLLLAACTRAEKPSSANEAVSLGPTAQATPTLLPGLPTSTPWTASDFYKVDGGEPLASATPSPTPTATGTPTATPMPAERLELGQSHLENENFEAAADQLQEGLASDDLTQSQRQEALMALGQAQMQAGEESAASEAFSTLLADATGTGEVVEGEESAVNGDDPVQVENAYYHLAQSYADQGDCRAAIGAYNAYLEANSALTAYVQPLIAECYLILGERQPAIVAYEAAAASDALPAVTVGQRYRLAQLYLEEGDYPAAVEQYKAVIDLAEGQNTLGEATYLAGAAEIMAGNLERGFTLYQEAVQSYPQAYESYLALVALVDAGYEVDDLQRGVVDYHAKAYEPAVAALSRYLQSQEEHNEDAHLYLAWSLEGLGNLPAALDQLQAYIDAHQPAENPQNEGETTASSAEAPDSLLRAAARGLIEKAKMLARSGAPLEAAEYYQSYVETYPEGEDGPFAAWWSAAIAEQQGDLPLAIERYQTLADLYPEHEDADEAVFRAGILSSGMGEVDQAVALWKMAAGLYPDDHHGAAALVWLLRTVDDEERESLLAQARMTKGSSYYPLRVRHIASDTQPFEAAPATEIELDAQDQREAELWLQARLALSSEADLAGLPDKLSEDGRLVRGQSLWRLGLREEAKRELESLRFDNASDPLSSYQLALFFRDLGLYRSSILAASSALSELGLDVFDAPEFIAGLAYPTYYADLIMAEAETYGYDPLLQFALVRQESLFESFATSGAAAQGLSQVIPDTGAYIAERLGLVDYVNEDLYKPYVGVAFGAYYLDQQLDAFDGDVAAALSAYNAGPGNAARWYEQAGGDIDLYVQIVDFSETRQYIERIYAGQAIYRHLYGGE
ncbi:MAG: tetratricopeptide repeat protein [Chloroflexota bacterium]|nr:MAG: tetratricopeptide repeat protein [Chloroflexota bacterium]